MSNTPDAKVLVCSACLRAIELQRDRYLALETETTKARRRAFFCLLNHYEADLFAGIIEAVEHGMTGFYPSSLKGFAVRCDVIFGIGGGRYNHGLLNEWLFAKDIKHMLHAGPEGAIRW